MLFGVWSLSGIANWLISLQVFGKKDRFDRSSQALWSFLARDEGDLPQFSCFRAALSLMRSAGPSCRSCSGAIETARTLPRRIDCRPLFPAIGRCPNYPSPHFKFLLIFCCSASTALWALWLFELRFACAAFLRSTWIPNWEPWASIPFLFKKPSFWVLGQRILVVGLLRRLQNFRWIFRRRRRGSGGRSVQMCCRYREHRLMVFPSRHC